MLHHLFTNVDLIYQLLFDPLQWAKWLLFALSANSQWSQTGQFLRPFASIIHVKYDVQSFTDPFTIKIHDDDLKLYASIGADVCF